MLARPVWRPDPAGRLPSAPLLTALGEVAARRGVPLDELLPDPSDRATLLGIVRRTAAAASPAMATPDVSATPRADGPAATRVASASTSGLASGLATGRAGGSGVDAAVAGRLASAAGRDPVEIYRAGNGTDRYTSALAHAGGRNDVRRVAVDVTVSAPKSVSVLQGSADPETAELIERCHDRAVTQALGYLQRQAGHGLRGHHGDGQVMARVGTGGWIAAGFTHYSSRAGDPQLHTHLVVPNLLHGQDGKWSALDSRALFRQAKTAGYLYQAALRHELTRELGVTWTGTVNGQADIEGVPRVVLREFSERRRQIENALAASGATGRGAAQAACLATRQRKQHTPLQTLRASWADRTVALGTTPARLLPAAGIRSGRRWSRRPEPPPPGPFLGLPEAQLAQVAAQVLGPGGVTARQTGFDRRDLLQALAVNVPNEHAGDALALEQLADQLLHQPDAVPLEPGTENEPRWTTLELLATEHRALELAASATPLTPSSGEHLRELLSYRGLPLEQREALRILDGDPRLARVLVGPAGSGKTAVLSVVREVAARDGQPVIGCALASLTAQRLQQASGIPSSSLASLLARLEAGQSLQPRSLVVVDEAGMVGTRDLTLLFEHAQQAGGRVLLVSDPEQLPEIDAGGLFRHLSQPEARPAQLRGNQRQRYCWEAGALEQLRANRPVIALGEYVRNDRLTLSPDRDAMYERISTDYLHATAASSGPEQHRQVVVLATRRSDVDQLNHTIRLALQATGRLGPDQLHSPETGTGYAVGDEVIVVVQCRDADGRKVLNGTRGHVTSADPSGLSQQPDQGPVIALTTAAVEASVQHGYAMTIHKAQGLTATTALILSDGLTRQSAYTALSRGREHNQLYLHDDPGTFLNATPFQRLCDQLARTTGDTLASHRIRRPARGLASAREYEPSYPQPPSQGRSIGF